MKVAGSIFRMGVVFWTAESREGGERDTHWIWILDRMSRLNKEEITNVRTLANVSNNTIVNSELHSILSPRFLPYRYPQAKDHLSSVFARQRSKHIPSFANNIECMMLVCVVVKQ